MDCGICRDARLVEQRVEGDEAPARRRRRRRRAPGSGSPSQSCRSSAAANARDSPKFGSSRALKVMPTAAAENSSGRKYRTEQERPVALAAGHEDAEQQAQSGTARRSVSTRQHGRSAPSPAGRPGSRAPTTQFSPPVHCGVPRPSHSMKDSTRTPSSGTIAKMPKKTRAGASSQLLGPAPARALRRRGGCARASERPVHRGRNSSGLISPAKTWLRLVSRACPWSAGSAWSQESWKFGASWTIDVGEVEVLRVLGLGDPVLHARPRRGSARRRRCVSTASSSRVHVVEVLDGRGLLLLGRVRGHGPEVRRVADDVLRVALPALDRRGTWCSPRLPSAVHSGASVRKLRVDPAARAASWPPGRCARAPRRRPRRPPRTRSVAEAAGLDELLDLAPGPR